MKQRLINAGLKGLASARGAVARADRALWRLELHLVARDLETRMRARGSRRSYVITHVGPPAEA